MQPTSLHLHQLRRDHMRILVQVVEYVQQQLSDAAVLDAASGWFHLRLTSGSALESLLVDRGADVEFYPWLAWDAPLPTGPLGGNLAQQLAPGRDRAILQALLNSPPQVYKVTDLLEDAAVLLPLGKHGPSGEITVHEPVLAKLAQVGELLVARLPQVDGLHLMDAVHATLPARCSRAMSTAQAQADALPRADQLRFLLHAARRALSRTAPSPATPMAQRSCRTTLVLRIPDHAAAQQTLHHHCSAGHLERLTPRSFALTASSLGPAGAVLRLHGARLHASTVQPDRVDDLQAVVAQWLPQAQLQVTLHRDLGPLFDAQTPQHRDAGEWRRLAGDWLCEVLASFAETPQPGLGGATPKLLAATAKGRQQLRAWLRTAAIVAALAEPRYQRLLQRVRDELRLA